MSRVARLGAFIIAALAVLASGVFIIGSKQYLFKNTFEVRAQFDNVAGLATGADVRVGGVHSGIVRRIELPHRPGERVTAVMELDKSTREIVKHDSVASIETEGVLGSQYLALSFGTYGQAEVKDGEILQSEDPLQMSDMLKKANGILDNSQDAIRNTTEATSHLNSVSAKIDAGQGTVGALVNDKQLYQNLSQATDSLHGTIAQAQLGVTDFRENMEALKHNFLLRGYFKSRGYEDSAGMTENRIDAIPEGVPLKTFGYTGRELFDSQDSAKLKNQKTLDAAGRYLAQNQFGFAVVEVSVGMQGDSQKDLLLTQARAMVVREYLVQNFGFDDSQLKILGMGKQSGAGPDAEWGSVQVLIFPEGAAIAPAKTLQVEGQRKSADEVQPHITDAAAQKP